jgi:signal transduction histidine kinase
MFAMAASTPWRIHAIDVAVVALLLLLACYSIAALPEPDLPTPDVAEYALGVVATVPLLLWRRAPVVTFCLVAGAVAVTVAVGYAFGPVMLPLMLATVMIAWRLQGWSLYRVGLGYGAALLAAFAVRCALLADDQAGFLIRWTTSALLWLALPAGVGAALRIRQQATARIRAERARRAAAEEQLRIAQELHDVVGHGLAVIAMQASAGIHVIERDPARAAQALTTIEETARDALDGLRAEVAGLRPLASSTRDIGISAAPGAPLRPSGGLAELDQLVSRIRGGGVDIVLDLDPPLSSRSLPAETDHAAYRIVQEALTNVLRHAGAGAIARVVIRCTMTELTIEVTNTLPRPTADSHGGGGMGIRGMRSRAERLGGRVEAGLGADGKFRVLAALPVSAPVPALARRS